MKIHTRSKFTQSVHAGSRKDPLYKGVVMPVYPSSAYDYVGLPANVYPRYFNTPNQQALGEKLAALENGECGVVFSSGMAAIFTSLFSVMRTGDHAVLQNDLYGGTYHAIVTEFERYGMQHTFVDGADPANFEAALRPNTRVLFIESPSNPLLKITDIRAVATIARRHGVITIIDNTFATPINQNPIDLGIDIVTHSGTKYLGGHSDLCFGAVVTTAPLAANILTSATHFGGSLDPQTCWLVERSLKTLALRVRQQNSNAQMVAEFLKSDARVRSVHYPGLPDHPGHAVASEQMPGGFGGMLAFEVHSDADGFMARLELIQRALSLGGVETTICSPAKTSHEKMSASERAAIGITDNLVRLSVGIEEASDLINDIKLALR